MTQPPAYGSLAAQPAPAQIGDPSELDWLQGALRWLTALTLTCFAWDALSGVLLS